MKKCYRLWVGILLLILLTACHSNPRQQGDAEGAEDTKISIDALKAAVLKDYSLELMHADGDFLESLYGIKPEDVDDYQLWVPAKNILANEMLMVRCSSDEMRAKVKEAMLDRQKTVKQIFESYAPEQYDLADRAELVESGAYIIFIIDQDARDITKLLENML